MNESRATRYQRERRRTQTAGVIGGALVLGVLSFTGAGASLSAWAHGFVEGLPRWIIEPAALVLFAVVIVIAWELTSLAILLGMRRASVRTRYEQASPGESRSVFADALLAATFAEAVGVVAGAVIIAASWLAPSWWWLIAGMLAGAGLVAALQGSATWLAKAAGARPIDRPALVEELGALARKVRVPIDSIDRLPAASTLTASAMVTGAGERRRVFIADDLMRDWRDDEIAVVVAHELAHHAHRDLWITVVFDGLVLVGAFRAAEWARGAMGTGGGAAVTLAELPLIALAAGVVWIASAPLRHALSRWQERRADTFALRLPGRPDAVQAAVKRLAAAHLAEENPSLLTRVLFHRHPSAAERLEAAAAFQRRG